MSRYSSTVKSTSLLKDNSWIKKVDDEDENIDRDLNFGKSVLGQHPTDGTPAGSESEEIKTTRTTSNSTSVQALSKRFSGSQDELRSSNNTFPSSKSSSSYTKSTYSTLKSDSPSSTRTTSVSKDGTTTETTTTTTSLRSPVIKGSTKTETFTERVKSSSKGAEDKLYNTLIPSSIKGDLSSIDSKTSISSTKTVTVKSSTNGNGVETTTTTKTSSAAEDDLYDTLLPRSITSASNLSSSVSSNNSSSSITKREIITVESSKGGETPTLSSSSSKSKTTSYSSYTDDLPSTRTTSYTISTKPSDDYGDRQSFSYSRPDSSYEYSGITSPTVYSSYRSSSRSEDMVDSIYRESSMKSVYAAPKRAVLEKDLCSYCRNPFSGDAKMVLDDMNINCHASCFKCEVCNSNLGNMKAGDSMWIYKRMVHCESCFEVTRDKWRR
ncbi:sciellin isoform X2 [Etheostoma cragini]|uniref:sciellin isoform X2 n=1 Tax=Etheostoma cragini TaxID=417921 RepID=UPI00155E8B67|nr:sciellin isoform X2 [Etheostoma cragini]